MTALREQTVSTRFAFRILRAAADRGVSRETLVRDAKLTLPTEESTDARMPADAFVRLWEAAIAAVGDVAFPLDVAAGVKAALHDVLGFAFITAGTLREALERAIRYLAISTDSARWQQAKEADAVRYTLVRSGLPGPAGPSDPRWHPGDLFALAELVAGGRQVTGVSWAPLDVCLTLAEPADTSRLRAFFEAPITYGCERTSWLLSNALLDLPLQKADPELLAYFDQQAELLLSRHAASDVVGQVRRLAMQTLGGELLTLEAASAAMKVSPRSLHRQLREHGTTFTKVIDELRSELAQYHLADPRQTIAGVAFLLGYSEPSAFHRAFQRWTGMTPQAFRGRK